MAQVKNPVQGIKDHSDFLSGPIPYIPIDFIKSEIINFDVNILINNPLLNFTRAVNEDTGDLEISEKIMGRIRLIPRIAKHKDLTFKVYDNHKIYLSGSLHKYFNEGLHNYNNFICDNYLMALKRLEIDFNITPENIRIQTLEYGINITPPIDTNTILKYCFVHGRNKLTDTIPYSKGRYKQAHYQKYVFKLYNKRLQYEKDFKIDSEIFRIEIKQTNWSEYRKRGINTLADFNQFDKVIFVKDLIEQWERVIYYNPENIVMYKGAQYRNPLFWEGFKNKSRSLFSYHKNELKKINPVDSNIQKNISEIIVRQINALQGQFLNIIELPN
jgi:hypothetical protein